MHWIRLSSGFVLLLVGFLGAGLALASVAFAEDAPATEELKPAADGDGSVKAEEPQAKKKIADMTLEEKVDLALSSSVQVVEDGDDAGTVKNGSLYGEMDTLWTCLAAFLVFFMQAGFALVECGFTRAKNACNIIMKNVMDFSIGSIAFWLVGFGLMFGTSYYGIIGTSKFLFDAGDVSFDWAFLIFQTVFCATAATIVSGAMAERTKFVSYLVYTAAISVIVYPIFGSWVWNGDGWLAAKVGFHDFAGSTVVHSIGGWCALAGAIVLGARIGKFGKNGKVNVIPGHSIPLAALGVFILWLGWFGFNPGSTVAVGGGNFAFIAVTTNLAAAAGSISAMFAAWILFKKPDPSFTLNGALAGLVAITAGCDVIDPVFAILTGAIAGVIVVFSVRFIDKLRIDDPVGAVSVHAMCGAFGTLAVGLFMKDGGLLLGGGFTQLIAQSIGVAAAFLWAFPTSMCIFLGLKYTIGLRVSELEELEGLDIHEHGMHAYPPNLVADGVPGSVPVLSYATQAAPAMTPAAEGV